MILSHLFSCAAGAPRRLLLPSCPARRGGDEGKRSWDWLALCSTFPLPPRKSYRVPSALIRATTDFFLRRNAAVPKATPTLLANSTIPGPTA